MRRANWRDAWIRWVDGEGLDRTGWGLKGTFPFVSRDGRTHYARCFLVVIACAVT